MQIHNGWYVQVQIHNYPPQEVVQVVKQVQMAKDNNNAKARDLKITTFLETSAGRFVQRLLSFLTDGCISLPRKELRLSQLDSHLFQLET